MIKFMFVEKDEHRYNRLLNNYNIDGQTFIKEISKFKDQSYILKLVVNKEIYYADTDMADIISICKEDSLKFEVFIELLKYNTSVYFIESSYKHLKNDYHRTEIAKLYIQNPNFSKMIASKLIMPIHNDEFKKSVLYLFEDPFTEAQIISSMDNDQIKIDALNNPKYSDYKIILVKSIRRVPLLVDIIRSCEDKDLRYNILKNLDDKDYRREIIAELKKKSQAYHTFINEVKSYTIQDVNISSNEIDPNITFGVELECCNEDIELFDDATTIGDFRITDDVTVKKGFEVVSPILHYTKEDLGKLKEVCNILHDSNFYTDNSCGGHIHVGAAYFTTPKEYETLLYMYINCENILYHILNKENTSIRINTLEFAKPIEPSYTQRINFGLPVISWSLKDTKLNIRMIQNKDRYYGLNFENLDLYKKNTIEFRIPNGEIDFDELKANIKLVTSLQQTAKYLASKDFENYSKQNMLNLSNSDITEEERLEILLSLLFTNENDKDIYRRRYYSNIKLDNETVNKKLSKLSTLDFYNSKR